MFSKPSIPKGMRDFSSIQVFKRNYIFDAIKEVFKLYGYSPLETPTMENLTTLMGKYGAEGDKLLFKVLDSGDFLKNVNNDSASLLSTQICSKGLRYDLTVPFARYVVQHKNELVFPFKRYQIQPVWRADRPQKGRYREFYQCDIDVIGSDSLMYEAELISIIGEVFKKLNINVTLKINNRKILYSIAEIIGCVDKIIDITTAIDKLDKIGIDAVNEELLNKGLSADAIQNLNPILKLSGSNEDKLEQLSDIVSASEVGLIGISEVREILDYTQYFSHIPDIELDLSLARGLSYYTGTIFEVKSNDHAIGSILGGGRYDDLTGIFGLDNMSGVGISFGAERIYDVMEALNLFPETTNHTTRILFANMGKDSEYKCLKLLQEVRSNGISAEMYPCYDKLKKQFSYAESKGATYIAFIGEEEAKTDTINIKNIMTGEQKNVSFDHLIENIF